VPATAVTEFVTDSPTAVTEFVTDSPTALTEPETALTAEARDSVGNR
jgi:hypothetical protein